MKKRHKDKLRGKKANRTITHSLRQLGVANRISNARKYPICECLINPSWRKEGLARILLSRQQSNNDFLFGVYLVDIFCLGLKNTFCNASFSLSQYEDLKPQIFRDAKPVDCPIALAHRIIYGAIEYASSLGFKPHKDFEVSRHILEDESTGSGDIEVEFGKNGKPFFIAGPDDNVELIIKRLETELGAGNFTFLLPFEH